MGILLFFLKRIGRKFLFIVGGYAQKKPTTTINEYISKIKEKHKLKVSHSTLSKLFRSWRWSWKKPEFKQLHKYTPKNIEYYATYLTSIREIPLHKLKFADECHLVSRQLFQQKALGPVGKTTTLIRSGDLAYSCTLTLCTSLDGEAPFPI